MAATSIQWTDHSINPIRARHRETGDVGHYCEKVSAGCANCYASKLQYRFRMPVFPGKQADSRVEQVDEFTAIVNDQIEVFFDVSKLEEVVRRKKPTRYFWCDMTDLFGWWVPDDWIEKCFRVMVATPQHTHMVLTKRPGRLANQVPGIFDAVFGKQLSFGVGERVLAEHTNSYLVPPNIWLGTSAENQRAAQQRIPELLECPAALRFVSVEPLIDALDLSPWLFSSDGFVSTEDRGPVHRDDGGVALDWVIVGGESGPRARPCYLHWIENLIKQCQTGAASVFVKQTGRNFWMQDVRRGKLQFEYVDSKGGDPSEWPVEIRVREFPERSLQGI